VIKFIHTSDWHLGRTLHGHELLDLQRLCVERIAHAALGAGIDALVIAGDIFDRSVPAAGALTLFSDFLEHFAASGVRLIVIPGNHDSAERLAFLSPLMKRNGIHVIGDVPSPPIVIEKEGLSVNFFCLPYIFDEAKGGRLSGEIESLRAAIDDDAINVLVAHLYTAGGITSDSERFSGASGGVPPELFESFDYTALGHLHRPQRITERVRYCGSIFPYSVAEADHEKSMTLVEISDKENISITPIPLVCDRPITRLSGSFADFCDATFAADHADDFVEVTLTDVTLVENPADVIRRRFPWLLSVRQRIAETGDVGMQNFDRVSPRDVFAVFYETVNGEAPDDKVTESFLDTFAQVNQ